VFGDLARLGVHVVLSILDVPFVRDLYAGSTIETVMGARPSTAGRTGGGPWRR